MSALWGHLQRTDANGGSQPPARPGTSNLEDGKALACEVQSWKSTLNPHESLNFTDCISLEDQIKPRCKLQGLQRQCLIIDTLSPASQFCRISSGKHVCFAAPVSSPQSFHKLPNELDVNKVQLRAG